MLLILVIAGCGSEEGFPPPAEPATSPKVESVKDLPGAVVDLPGEAEGIVADPETGIVGVSVRDPDKLLLVSDLAPARARKGEVRRPGEPVLAGGEGARVGPAHAARRPRRPDPDHGRVHRRPDRGLAAGRQGDDDEGRRLPPRRDPGRQRPDLRRRRGRRLDLGRRGRRREDDAAGARATGRDRRLRQQHRRDRGRRARARHLRRRHARADRADRRRRRPDPHRRRPRRPLLRRRHRRATRS